MIQSHSFFRSIISTFATACLLMPSIAPAATGYTPKNPLIIKMTSFAMPTHAVVVNGFNPWAEELKEKSGGRMVVELYNPNTVCPDADVYDCVKSGIIDLGAHLTQRVKGAFPLSNVTDLPFVFSTAEQGSMVFNQLIAEFPDLQEEYAETKLFGGWVTAPYQLHSTKKPLHTLEDVQGLKVGTNGASMVPFLQSLGAASVNVPSSDCYMALQRGQIDAFLAANSFLVSTKIYEATKYTTILNAISNSIYVCMNRQVYDSMPVDLKAILDESLTVERFRAWGRITDDAAQSDLATVEKAGQQVSVMPPEELAKGRERSKGLVEAWYEGCAKRGKNDSARAIYKRAMELAAQYSQELGQ